MKPGTNQDVFTLEEGEVVLLWPNRLSQESFEDFKGWIELVLRKAKRAILTAEDSADSKQE